MCVCLCVNKYAGCDCVMREREREREGGREGGRERKREEGREGERETDCVTQLHNERFPVS